MLDSLAMHFYLLDMADYFRMLHKFAVRPAQHRYERYIEAAMEADRLLQEYEPIKIERDSLKKCMKFMTYDENGKNQDSLKLRCEKCPFNVDGECRVREEDDDRTDN